MQAIASTTARPSREHIAAVAAVATLAAAVSVAAGHNAGAYQSGALLAFGSAAALIVATDICTLRAPNAIVYPAFLGALGLAAPLGLDAFLSALSGGIAAFGVLFVVALVGRGAMGFGDVKAGALCGAAVGLSAVPLLLLSSFLIGGLFAAGALGLRIRQRKDVVAFTPFLVLGALIALAMGDAYLVR